MPKGIFARPVRKVEIPIGPSIAYVPLTQGQFALIDREDAADMGKQNWFAVFSPGMRGYYAATNVASGTRRQAMMSMHRALRPPLESMVVDHVNGNPLDNRKSNLRQATRLQNNQNSRMRSRNASGYKGVSFKKENGRFQAQIRVGGKCRYLGLFSSREDAFAAYCSAARRMHGDFARIA